VLHCSLGRTSLAQPKMSGVRPSKKKLKIFLKVCDFSAYNFIEFCLIMVCIFIL
jgi:hypothetical protein